MNDREQFELLAAKDWDAHDLPNFGLNSLGDYVDDEMFSAFAWFKKGLAARATPAANNLISLDAALACVPGGTICDPQQVADAIRTVPIVCATPAQPVPPQSSVGVAIRALQVGTSGSKGYVKAFCHGAVVMRDAAAELAEQAQGPQDDYEFERGVIACLGVLKAHGYPHGSVIHDEIVEAADPSRIYAAAEDEDYEWAGLDPSRKPGAPSIAQDGQKSETDHG